MAADSHPVTMHEIGSLLAQAAELRRCLAPHGAEAQVMVARLEQVEAAPHWETGELGPLRETMSEARALARALRDAREGKLAG